MAQNFIGCDREQSFLLPPDVSDWLLAGHLAWFVLDAVAGMDLSGFYGSYRADGVGRRAYDPAMMVALLLYGYSRGVRSARAIERCGVSDFAIGRPHFLTQCWVLVRDRFLLGRGCGPGLLSRRSRA